MQNQDQENSSDIRPQSIGQWCVYLLALAIVGIIEFVDAAPYHIRYYLWCTWHFTGGQIRLLYMSWRLRLEQQATRRSNPYYRKEAGHDLLS